MRSILFVVIGAIVLVGLPTFFSTMQTASYVRETESLSLREALGQTLLIGFEGKEMNPELETFMRKVQPGGVLLLARNIENAEQTKELIENLQEISPVPLFIAIDQEGGIVSRVWWEETTSQVLLEDEQHALQIGKQRAEGLAKIGMNMNLAPVLDSNNSGDYLFTRSFQLDPLLASLFAANLIMGHTKENMISVPKHYPGYDTVPFNPETYLIPRVKEFPLAEAFSNLFFYFAPPILMLSHVVYEDIDDKNPLPLSLIGIQKVKENIGEEALLMSDDLLSKVFIREYSSDVLGSRALLSGMDILLAVGYPKYDVVDEFYEGLWQKAKRNTVLADRIFASSKKILELKLALFNGQ